MRKVVETVIKKRVETYSEDKKNNKHSDLLSILLDEYFSSKNTKLSDNDEAKVTIDLLICSYFSLFLAGMETTATVLTNSMYYIVQYPEIQAKIRQEINQHIPDSNNMTIEQISKLTTLESFLNEVLRITMIVAQMFPRVIIIE